jgi:hypothetical protein
MRLKCTQSHSNPFVVQHSDAHKDIVAPYSIVHLLGLLKILYIRTRLLLIIEPIMEVLYIRTELLSIFKPSSWIFFISEQDYYSSSNPHHHYFQSYPRFKMALPIHHDSISKAFSSVITVLFSPGHSSLDLPGVYHSTQQQQDKSQHFQHSQHHHHFHHSHSHHLHHAHHHTSSKMCVTTDTVHEACRHVISITPPCFARRHPGIPFTRCKRTSILQAPSTLCPSCAAVFAEAHIDSFSGAQLANQFRRRENYGGVLIPSLGQHGIRMMDRDGNVFDRVIPRGSSWFTETVGDREAEATGARPRRELQFTELESLRQRSPEPRGRQRTRPGSPGSPGSRRDSRDPQPPRAPRDSRGPPAPRPPRSPMGPPSPRQRTRREPPRDPRDSRDPQPPRPRRESRGPEPPYAPRDSLDRPAPRPPRSPMGPPSPRQRTRREPPRDQRDPQPPRPRRESRGPGPPWAPRDSLDSPRSLMSSVGPPSPRQPTRREPLGNSRDPPDWRNPHFLRPPRTVGYRPSDRNSSMF